ncbi:nucleolar protein 10-like isoform X1 [Haliotis rufescens]|uniref:nucleolar protein 10-like isoform X1 n=2 Tax=Haliotis rufescens TaxID=6454 RepID=UPI00201E8E7C|nr:nucleolar protein 10-like isoform X1 [Haliotis rufescens]
MQVSNTNNIKIYNLSAGKSLPEWLSDRKKRKLRKSDVDIQRRIELIQDFEMPAVSRCVQVSRDGQYILTTGTYKPRLRCYDVHQLSLKFERGLDAEVLKFLVLSEDYTKVLFLEDERYVEFHTQFGRHYRTRIPKYGRDLAYHYPSCDVYFVGVSPEIYRLNLEHGRFLSPLVTSATEINCCEFNPMHQLFVCGTKEGHVECWDPRSRTRAGVLDTALSSHIEDLDTSVVPSVTAVKHRDGLNLAVGTSTGQILMYDIRWDKPVLVKDHMYELPIKDIEFQQSQDLVLTMDTKILKLWDRQTGKPFTAIEPGTDLNDFCQVPESGLMFMANEAPKLYTYYIPSLGTAPRWCSFLDNLTEELEESSTPSVYDDYKFVMRGELEELGLAHLVGSNLLRAYMHGFFMDIRLYHKAKAIADPFAYQTYRKSKIREKIDEERTNRVKLKKLPKVNRDLAEKLMAEQEEAALDKRKKKKQPTESLLEDNRFSAIFSNPDFHIDQSSEEFRLLNPVLSKRNHSKKTEVTESFTEVKEMEGRGSDEESSSSDDERTWTQEVKAQHRKLQREKRLRERQEMQEAHIKPKFCEMKEAEEIKSVHNKQKRKEMKMSLSERLAAEDSISVSEGGSIGNKEMTFTFKKSAHQRKKETLQQEHQTERRQIGRSAKEISKKIRTKPKFWMGKRVG